MVAAAAGRQGALVGHLASMGSMIAWAAGFPAAEALIATWPVALVTAARLVVALVVLLLIWVAVEGTADLRRARWLPGMAIGAVGFGGGALAILYAQALTDPVTVAIFAAASPLCAALIDAIWLGRRFSRGFLLGLVAAVAGGVIATGGSLGGAPGWGALLALTSCLLFSWATMMLGRDFADHTLMARTGISTAGAALVTSVVVLALLASGQTALPADLVAPRALGLLAIYAILSFVISQLLWIAAAERLGTSMAAFHINLAPFWTMLILLGLGEGWSWPQAIGAAVVALGVILAQR